MDGKSYVVTVNKSAVSKVISDTNMSPEKLAIFDDLDSIIESGEYVGSNRYTPKGKKQKQTLRFDLFETPVKIGGQDYVVTFDVEVFPTENNYRTHKVINKMSLTPVEPTDTGTHLPQETTDQSSFSDPTIAPGESGVKREDMQFSGKDTFVQTHRGKAAGGGDTGAVISFPGRPQRQLPY